MQKRSLCPTILVKLVLLTLVVLLPTFLAANILSHLKLGKHKHQPDNNRATAQTPPAMPLRMRRAESIPGHIGSGEPEGGPLAYEREKLANRAYPGTDIPIALTNTATQRFARVQSESENGARGQMLDSQWVSLGPSVALYPAVLGRTGAAFVASGRISALAIEQNCTRRRCRLYVGAAGGGIWRTNDALSDTPRWRFISDSFSTNAIGSITIDPTDASGDTIYVGTGEPNASADSGAGQGIYKSTDGGDSWSFVPGSTFAINRSIGSVVIDPTNANTIYVGTTRGVRGFSAVIGGGTGNPPPGTGSPVGLYKSGDGGNTFNLIFDSLANTPGGFSEGVNLVALDPTDPSTVYISAFGLGILRSSPSDMGGAFQPVFVSLGFNTNGALEDSFARSAFALTTKNGQTRMYVNDGGGNGGPPAQPGSAVWRNDNMNQPASALVVAGANGPSWKQLTSSNVADPGYAAYNTCTGQCWYDNEIYTPAGRPDTVYVLGSFVYGELFRVSNARGVVRSTTAGDPDPANNNRTFTDMTLDATSSTAPNSLHPDQHAMVFVASNPDIWFEGSDGGLMRSSGSYADVSSQCATRGLSPTATTTCQRLLSAVPTTLTSLNSGLDTLQFQSLSINPKKPTQELLGGTQDNGTFRYTGSGVLWPQTIGGDGGQSGFNVKNPDIRFHTYFIQQVDVNFQGTNPLGWDWVSDPLFTGEGSSFYIPIIADPNKKRAGSMFAGLQGVWRTTDNGGSQALLDPHCNEFTGDSTSVGGTVPFTCGDWVELGSPTGITDPQGRLSSTFWGTTRTGGVVAAVTRAPSNTGTLWAATTVGRVFISKNADAVSNVPGADGSTVTYTRLDSLDPNSPGRFISSIYVDPRNPNHAWISYSGYSARTPAQPGHVFDVTYDPVAGTAVWTSLDGSLGDIPITALVRDDATGDLYAANDFGVLRLPRGNTVWQTAARGLPKAEIPALSISTSARVLYAATHGRGAYVLQLPED
jgi:hypothetical protein